MQKITFKPLTMRDLTLLHQWLQEPSVKHWYEKDKDWSLNDIKEYYQLRISGKEHVPSFIAYLGDKPFGFIQYYVLTEFLPEGISGYAHEIFKQYSASNIAGVDLFIAKDLDRGKGVGVTLISQFIEEYLTDFKLVVVDPDIANQQAIRCYEKAGFEKTTHSTEPNHLILLKPLLQNPIQ